MEAGGGRLEGGWRWRPEEVDWREAGGGGRRR